MSNFWDERYSQPEYVYGEAPNAFFASQLIKLRPGCIVLPCEGEGRNGVYAASLGWEVKAFDLSEAGKYKALQLADKNKVSIEYIIADAYNASYPNDSVDAVALIYAHFPPGSRSKIHQKVVNWLKPGGCIFLEAFNPQQLQNTTGGPKDIAMLYTESIIREDFKGCRVELLQTLREDLKEGKHHEGIADIIRFVGVKN